MLQAPFEVFFLQLTTLHLWLIITVLQFSFYSCILGMHGSYAIATKKLQCLDDDAWENL